MFTTSQKKHGAMAAVKSSVCLAAVMLGLWGCEIADIWKDANDFEKSQTPKITLTLAPKATPEDTYEANGTTEVSLKVQISTAEIDKDKRGLKVTTDRGSFVVGTELKKSVDIQLDNNKETTLVYRVPREGAGVRMVVSTPDGLLVSEKNLKLKVACPDYMEIELQKTKVDSTATLAIRTLLFRNTGSGFVSTGLRPEYRLFDADKKVLENANFAGISRSDSNGVSVAQLILERYAPGKYVIEASMVKSGCTNAITSKTIEVLPPPAKKEEEKK